jgi:hypothetical protein
MLSIARNSSRLSNVRVKKKSSTRRIESKNGIILHLFNKNVGAFMSLTIDGTHIAYDVRGKQAMHETWEICVHKTNFSA